MVGEFSSVRCSIALTCAAHQGTTNEVKCGYVLVAFVTQMNRLEIGRLGAYDIVPAYYAYVGSAFGAGGLPRMAFSMPVGDIVNFAVQQLRLGGHLEQRNHQNVRHWRRFQFSSSIGLDPQVCGGRPQQLPEPCSAAKRSRNCIRSPT
jgi:hypothetical protein